MQTFFTSKNLQQSAYSLWEGGRKSNRLNNQINEALIILRTLSGWYLKEGRKGWPNHSCTKAWVGYEIYLIEYLYYHIREYERLSGNDCTKRIADVQECCELQKFGEYKVPHWLTNEFVGKHRSLLLGKAQGDTNLEKWYKSFNWSEQPAQPLENGKWPDLWKF